MGLQSVWAQAPALSWSTNAGATLIGIDAQTNLYAELNSDRESIVKLDSAGNTLSTNKISPSLAGLAREHGVTIQGAGLNPGFAFDALVLMLSGAAWNVETITVERVVDLSGFSETILRRLGIGFTPEEFAAGVAEQ